MSEKQFHGYESNAGVTLAIGSVPGRKRPALYVAITNEHCARICPLAFFATKEAVERAQELLDHFILKRPFPVPAQPEGDE